MVELYWTRLWEIDKPIDFPYILFVFEILKIPFFKNRQFSIFLEHSIKFSSIKIFEGIHNFRAFAIEFNVWVASLIYMYRIFNYSWFIKHWDNDTNYITVATLNSLPIGFCRLLLLFFNSFMPNVFSHLYQLDESISNFRVVGWYFSFLFKF